MREITLWKNPKPTTNNQQPLNAINRAKNWSSAHYSGGNMEKLAEAVNILVKMVERIQNDMRGLEMNLSIERQRVENLRNDLQKFRAPKEN